MSEENMTPEEVLEVLDHLEATANFIRASKTAKDNGLEPQQVLDFLRMVKSVTTLIKTYRADALKYRESSESLNIEKASNKRLRAALVLWDSVFGDVPIASIKGTAGDAVALAVQETRKALGKDSL